MPSIQTGQSAVLSMPKKASNSSSKNKEGNNSKWVQLDSVVIPPSLQVPKSVVRENGMVVFKVNKVRVFVCVCACVCAAHGKVESVSRHYYRHGLFGLCYFGFSV